MSELNPRPATAVNPDVRLSADDTFRFACGPHVPCFTECCGKLELVLTPYDVLRLKTRLDMPSEDFIDKYATIRWRTPHGFPDLVMTMDPDADKRCQFVTDRGCSIYEDRPGACRIYPLGRASTSHPLHGERSEFYFVVREDHCRGFEQPREWKIREWLEDQGMVEYNRMNDLLMELYVRRGGGRVASLEPRHIQMFMMACYNTERFRDFIFKSQFLQKFELDGALVESIREDDVKLLELAFSWLKFALFQEPALTVRP